MDTNTIASADREYSIKDIILIFGRLFKYLKSKVLIIIIAIGLGATIGLVYSCLTKPVYTAKLSFALDDEKSSGGLSSAAGLASQFGFDIGSSGGGGAFSGDNILELMKSRLIIGKVLLSVVNINGHNKTLADIYIDYNKYRSMWIDKPVLRNIHFNPGANPAKFSVTQDSILGIFYHNIIEKNILVGKVDKKLSIITVQVNSENELFAKYFAEKIVNEVSELYKEIKTKKSVQNVAILQHQTDSVRQALNNALTGVASSTDSNPNANPLLQVLRVPSQRRQVDVQANTAILSELVKNLELSKITLRKETPLVQIIDTPILPLQVEKFGKIKGIVLGAIIGGILTILTLILHKLYKRVIQND